MADTDIEWASKVWNVTRGCRRVSPGCGGASGEGGCYAEKQAYRFSGPGQPYEGLVRLGKGGPRWTGKGRFVAEKLAEPLSWRTPKDGSRHRIFVNSMSDLFFEEFTNEQIAAAFGVMAACPQHDFLILTKRAARLPEWFAWAAKEGVQSGLGLPDMFASHFATAVLDEKREEKDNQYRASFLHRAWRGQTWPLPNVWIGVSCENQETADERIPYLLQTPAAVRFVSAEPLLGPINFGQIGNVVMRDSLLIDDPSDTWGAPERHLDWVIVGGESGPGARPMDLAWARSIVQQCKAADVPAFMKQLGAVPVMDEKAWRAISSTPLLNPHNDRRAPPGTVPLAFEHSKAGDPAEWPEDLRVREFPAPEPR